jgi:hypothetical protein
MYDGLEDEPEPGESDEVATDMLLAMGLADADVDDGTDEPEDVPVSEAPAHDAAMAYTLLSMAEKAVLQFARDNCQRPVTLPSALTAADRQALHSLAGKLGLGHESTGEGHERHLVISAGPASTGPGAGKRWTCITDFLVTWCT